MAKPLRVGIVVPHIFMHRDILPTVIFSPGTLALALAKGLRSQDVAVTLFTPGPVDTEVSNITADLSLFEQELATRGDSYLDLLKKHPFTFITLSRQVQSEIVATAFAMANHGELDVVHIYTNEEDIALPFAQLCSKPVVFTHHDPYNFLVKYKNVFPKYKQLNWLSVSMAQRRGMPSDTNWIANIYHGDDPELFKPVDNPDNDYLLCMGRIILSKGTHLAIHAVKQYNRTHPDKPLILKLAGKHYSGAKDKYWQEQIEPLIDGREIQYVGFVDDSQAKCQLLANAKALIIPSTFEEPFGMVMIEALACGTPVIGLDSGAIPEVIRQGTTGFVAKKSNDESVVIKDLCAVISHIDEIKRPNCRKDFESRFTTEKMCELHKEVYKNLVNTDGLRR